MSEMRIFSAGCDETTVIPISGALDEASDVLIAARMFDEKRARLLVACEQGGRDPVDFARHLVKLNGALRNPDGAK
jgi:hypothetical protein